MKIIFIRHGKTEGNLFKRYIGCTDESLCDSGVQEIKKNLEEGIYKEFEKEKKKLFVSPYKRCIETAEIIFGDFEKTVVYDFRECNFGKFENKNYQELEGTKAYQNWIDSDGTLPFPEGEDVEEFKERCNRAFIQMAEMCQKAQKEERKEEREGEENVVVLVVHNGTIMSIFERYEAEGRNYYSYGVENGHGYVTELNGKTLKILREF